MSYTGPKVALVPITSMIGGLGAYAGTERVEKPLPPVPGLDIPGKLSEDLLSKWQQASKRYEEVIARGRK